MGQMERISENERIRIAIEALAWFNQFRGKTFVVKFGGNAMKSNNIIQNVVDNCLLLYETGIKVILVHGGGPDIDEELNKKQIPIKKIDGLRYTSQEVMDVVKRVLVEKTNADIVSRFNGKGAPLHGKFLYCEKKLSQNGADLGFVGNVKKVDLTPITEILAKDMIPVIASVGVGENNQDYNINADDAAAEIAKEINADKLLFMSDIDGVLDKDKKLISELSEAAVANLISDGTISGGMIPKSNACIEALNANVGAVHIISGTTMNSLFRELSTIEGIGTKFVRKGEEVDLLKYVSKLSE